MEELPMEAIALISTYREALYIAVSVLRDSMLGWVTTISSEAALARIVEGQSAAR